MGLLCQPAAKVEPTNRRCHLGMDRQDDVAGHLLEVHLVQGLEDEPESTGLLGVGVEHWRVLEEGCENEGGDEDGE